MATSQPSDTPSCSNSKQDGSDGDLDPDARLARQLAYEDGANVDCSSDTALAIILQKQFDAEHDCQLAKREAHLNGRSKVGVSLDNFRRSDHTSLDGDPFFQLDRVEPNSKDWDVFEQTEKRQCAMGRHGFYRDEEGNVITKHDIPTSNRRNMCRLMELKTDLSTGDAGSIKDDFKINNNVYNQLKVYSKKSTRRAPRSVPSTKEKSLKTTQ